MSSNESTSNQSARPIGSFPGPITSAAAHLNNQRRMSMSSASSSPPRLQPSFSLRRGSVSSISSTSSMQDESAIDDSEPASGSPTSPFARRMSWGARALRDVRIPVASARVPPSPGTSPTVSRGFWLDNGNKGSYPNEAASKRRMSMPAPPVAAMPPAPKEKSIDPMQERMLRNELYLD